MSYVLILRICRYYWYLLAIFCVPISDEFVANLVDVVLQSKTLVNFIEIDQFSI